MSWSASRAIAGRTGCQDMPALQAVILPAAEHSNTTQCSTTTLHQKLCVSCVAESNYLFCRFSFPMASQGMKNLLGYTTAPRKPIYCLVQLARRFKVLFADCSSCPLTCDG